MDLDSIKKTVENIGANLEPDDDWMPALIFEKGKEVIVVGLAGDSMLNQETKDMTAALMTKLVQETQPESVAFVATAWCVQAQKDFKRGDFRSGKMPMPSEHPDRFEIVFCTCVSPTSETIIYSKVSRFPDSHPKLGPWEEIGGGQPSEGRFAEALRNGFRKEEDGNNKTSTVGETTNRVFGKRNI